MSFNSLGLYFASVFIWGSTFYAIKFQLGDVAPELSVAYRFALASVLLFGWCLLRKLPLRFSWQQHFWMATLGFFLFSTNYVVVYWATAQLTSGLIAVVFSTIILMNIINSAIFFRKSINGLTAAAALIGLAGISLIFWPELSRFQSNPAALTGLLLSFLGTFIASLGNIVSARNQQHELPVVQCNAYGMAYGAAMLILLAFITDIPLTYAFTWEYNLSLLYLALFGSVLAFGSYLTLLGRIGPEKAAYTMILFPIVALIISTLFEGYTWSLSALFGIALVLSGNLLLILPRTFFGSLRTRLKLSRASI